METARYRKLSDFLRRTFGKKVFKVTLSGGFTCPNRDGSLGYGGCTFCNPESWEALNLVRGSSIPIQLRAGMDYVRKRHGAELFLAYMNDYTNTYGELKRLETLYRQALEPPEVIGLVISTRPDCLTDEVLALLSDLKREHFIWLEIGIQTAKNETLHKVNRCHTVEDSIEAVHALHRLGIAVSAHLMLGLPGETKEDMLESIHLVRELGVHGVKLHNLHIVKDTVMEKQYRRGEIPLLTLQEYALLVKDLLEHLPPTMLIHRLSSESPKRLTVAPAWSPNRWLAFNAINKALQNYDSWQGKALGYPLDALTTPITIPGLNRSLPHTAGTSR